MRKMKAEMDKVEYVLAQAQSAENVVVICFDVDGEMALYSTITNGPEILWSLEIAKSQVLEMGQPEDA
jgi:hypothetical protein